MTEKNYTHLAKMVYDMHIPTYNWIFYNCDKNDLEKIADELNKNFIDEDSPTNTDTRFDYIIDNIEDYAEEIPYDLYNGVLDFIITWWEEIE